MTYVVNVEVINPFGMCRGEDLPKDLYTPYARFDVIGYELGNYVFRSFTGRDLTSRYTGHSSHLWIVDRDAPSTDTIITDYFFQAYDISDNYRKFSWSDAFEPWNTTNENHQRTFETEAEALEYVDTLGNPEPSMRIPGVDRSTGALFRTSWRQEIDGVWINRNANLTYTGEQVVIYTINDLINFLALFFGITPEEVPVVYSLQSGPVVPQDTPEPSINCETYLKATIVDVDGPGEAIEIDIDFTGSSIGDVTVTIIDGDPPSTSLENGDGSITISDNGNILMLNDGGTFFLNEFGNVGFYANGDASLTADNQVQLGVGQNSVTVENGSLTIRDETGSATLTAEDINRLKETLT